MEMSHVIPWIIGFAIRTALLTALLWIMIKLQKMNYFFLGLLVAAAVACALDSIPFVGHYLAVIVLYIAIWKITGATLFPDAVFTVVISYALVFAVNMLLLTAMIGHLGPGIAEDDPTETPADVAPAKPVPSTAKVAAQTNASPAAGRATSTNSADAWLKDVVVKGATENGKKSLLVIGVKKKTYTLAMDEETAIEFPKGAARMRLLNLNGSWATVELNGQSAYLEVPQ
jgi:hypothetical protein